VRVDYTQGAELTPTVYQNIGYTDFSQDWAIENSTLTESQTTAPDGTTPVYELTENTSTSRHRLYRGFPNIMTLVVGQDYTVSAYVKKVSSGRFFLINSSALNGIKGFLNLDTGVATLTNGTGTISVTDEGGGWYRLSVTAQATSTNGFVYMQLQNAQTDSNYTGTGASMLIYGPQLEEGTTASDFVENTTGSPKFITGATYGPRVPMILVEPSATNSFLYSQPTSALAFGNSATKTFNDAIAPNGEIEAFRITHNGASGSVNFRATSSITFGSDSMVLSVWAKAGSGGNNYFTWSFQNLGGAVVRAGFKLEGDGETQLITSGNGGHTLQIETYPDGWYRCIIIGNTQSSGTTTQFLYTVSGYNESSSIAGGSVLLWGFQVETGSVATSYIPTSGSTAQRAADDLVISGGDFTDFYNASEGTWYCEAVPKGNDGSENYTFILEYGTANTDRVGFFYYVADGSLSVTGFNSNSQYYNQTKLGDSTNQLARLSYSYESGNHKSAINGTSDSDTDTVVPPANQLKLGKRIVGTNGSLVGHIKRVLFWPYSSDRL